MQFESELFDKKSFWGKNKDKNLGESSTNIDLVPEYIFGGFFTYKYE